MRSGRSLNLPGDCVGTSAEATTIRRANRDHNIHDEDVRSLLAAALAKMKIIQEEGGVFETSSSFLSLPSSASSVALLGFGNQMRDTVEARESSILNAGQGLFARQEIKTGTIVSLYPVHCLGVDCAQEDDESSPTVRCYMDKLDEQYFERQQEHGNAGAYLQFLMGSRSLLNTNVNGPLLRGRPLFVDVNPQRATGRPINCHNATTTTTTASSSCCFLAHLVNDGSIVREASEQGLLDYYTSSRQRKNCVFIPFGPAPVLALVTTCDVPRGEELLTSYGANYWMERLAHDVDVVAGNLAGGDENEDIITDQVLALVRESARDILVSMRAAHATHGHQQDALTKIWDAL